VHAYALVLLVHVYALTRGFHLCYLCTRVVHLCGARVWFTCVVHVCGSLVLVYVHSCMCMHLCYSCTCMHTLVHCFSGALVGFHLRMCLTCAHVCIHLSMCLLMPPCVCSCVRMRWVTYAHACFNLVHLRKVSKFPQPVG